MAAIDVEVRDEKVRNALLRIQSKEAHRISRRALNKGASIIKKEAQHNLEMDMKGGKAAANSARTNAKKGWHISWKDKRGGEIKSIQTLKEGIQIKYHKEGEDGDGPFTKLNIMGGGSRTKKGGDFRLKFFEKGTQERHKNNRQNSSTGHITAIWFLKKAIEAKQTEVGETVANIIHDGIVKMWNEEG